MRLPSAIGVVVVVAGLLSPLGSGSNHRHHARPTGFPLVWRVADGAVVGREESSTTRRLHSVWSLRSDKGSVPGFLYADWTEALRKTSRAAQCGGLRYNGKSVNETLHAGTAWFGMVPQTAEADTTARLTITRRTAIYRGSPGPPICTEFVGTAVGETGALGGFRGTFTLRNDETLVFTPR